MTAPPQIESNILVSHKYRFVSTSGTVTQLTPTSLLCAAGSVGTVVNTTVTSFFGSVKINRVEIWSPPASQGAAVTCSVEWAGSVAPFIADREVSDTTVSVARPAHLSTRPPRLSLASFWQTAAATTICAVTAPVGSIIDVHLSLTLYDDNGNVPQATSVVATAVLGTVYYLSLDPNANHRYTPVSLTTTI